MANEPGRIVINSIENLNKVRKNPVFIVFSTNKAIKLRRGNVVGKITLMKSGEIASVGKSYDNEETHNSTDINVPPEHKDVISRLVEEISDIFV